jgi:hypothetical protein
MIRLGSLTKAHRARIEQGRPGEKQENHQFIYPEHGTLVNFVSRNYAEARSGCGVYR